MAFSSVSALIAIGVAAGSVGLARLRVRGVRILTICSLLPPLADVVAGMLWLSPMGGNVAYATGIGLGGLTLMKLSLLPLWAGLLWMFVFRQPRPLPPP